MSKDDFAPLAQDLAHARGEVAKVAPKQHDPHDALCCCCRTLELALATAQSALEAYCCCCDDH